MIFDKRHSSGFSYCRVESDQRKKKERKSRQYLVVQRLYLLLALALANLVRVGDLEELRGDLDEPLGLDREHIVTVLACGEDELVIDAPFGWAVE